MIARLLISKSPSVIKEKIKEVLKEANLSFNHPDLLFFEAGEKLGIEQARKIKEHFSLKPYNAKGRGVVLEDASTLTPDAQNALLKTLEEPPSEALLILGASSDSKFLPTILSRVQVIRLEDTTGEIETKDYTEKIDKLLSSSIAERFEFVEKLKEKEEFLQSLIKYFHNTFRSQPKENLKLLKELQQAEQWANQNVNPRAILEYLMLVMPKS